MFRTASVAFVFLIAVPAYELLCNAKEPATLLGRVAVWQYPGAEMRGGATMSDGATVDKHGKRTVASIQCKTVLVTTDSIEKVVEFYKSKLSTDVDEEVKEDEDAADEVDAMETGRSVSFHEDSDGRPVAIHIISVNTDKTSTNLVISRVEKESETHIAWTQYEKLDYSR